MNIFFDSHVGKKRQNNEDNVKSILLGKQLYVLIVADGVGGEKKGEVASELAITHIEQYLSENMKDVNAAKGDKEKTIHLIKDAILRANYIIKELANSEEYYKMATTVVLAFIYKNQMLVANVGDSRCYLLKRKKGQCHLEQITKDNTFVQELMDKGLITPEEAKTSRDKNTITRAVGAEYDLDIDIYELTLEKSDVVMLCSDGLTDMLEHSEMEEIMENVNIENMVENLIQKSLEKGGRDNITVLCAENCEVMK
ncbi:MAG: Stp1/IreP family PP2C-type Ser/Thr phosphatase [Peptostreptococcaceae bacterium]|nr:Stp1/IreP family PP2C-type Ser/Thr phosphatase [Peptostreptococcaceae bacterium]